MLRRVWSPRGVRPLALIYPRYEWGWVYGGGNPRAGRIFWLVLPYLNAEMMQLFLDEFARSHAAASQRIVLVLDGATAHRAKALRVPECLTLVGLPAYTPELNPTERLWPLVKEGIANRTRRLRRWSRKSAHVVKESPPRKSRRERTITGGRRHESP